MGYSLHVPGGTINYTDAAAFEVIDGGALKVSTDSGVHYVGPTAWLAVVDNDADDATKIDWEMISQQIPDHP